MSATGDDFNRPAVAAPWLKWHPDWPVMRWVALATAGYCALVGGLACNGPVVAKLGPVHLAVDNPLKALLAAAAALQIWCLFTPRIHLAAERRLRLSLWRIVFAGWAVETGVLALLGMASTNLCWNSANIWSSPAPTICAAVSFFFTALALTTADLRWPLLAMTQRSIVQWKRWNWPSRIVLIFFCLNLIFLCHGYVTYWKHASAMFCYHDGLPSNWRTVDGKPAANFDYFCEQCRTQIPQDARILYHGPNDGLVLAYKLYPRRVFMLPQEQQNMNQNCWLLEEWCQGMTADPLDAFWKWDPPLRDVSEENFIADHHITHVVTFDHTNLAIIGIRPLR
jgi:hypothetical protein